MGNIMKKLLFVFITLLISACSSSPVKIGDTTSSVFDSSHGCFFINSTHLKKEFRIYACSGRAYKDFWRYPNGLETSLFKIDDNVYIDVFNEYKKTDNNLKNCYSKEVFQLVDNAASVNTTRFYIEVAYECNEN